MRHHIELSGRDRLSRGIKLCSGGAVLALLAALAGAGPTSAKPAKARKSHAHAAASTVGLRTEIEALQSNLAAERAARLRLEAKMAQMETTSQETQAAQAQIAAAEVQQARVDAAAIETLPATIALEVAKVKPKTDALYVKGLKITLGGFLEAAGVYRQHDTANDISTGLNTIPYPTTRAGHLGETLFTPRQSRLSALVEGRPNPDVTLSMYGEFDFQGAAQSANSNETNSYNPRIRHLYGTVDWADEGWHFLAGQTFSLVTLDSKGITPRNEVTPLTIDGQYNVGFTWARQPGVRVVKDLFDKSLWLAISAENPQTTFSGSVPTGVINTVNNGQGYYAGDTGALAATTNAAGQVTAVSGVAPATQSLAHVPDFIAKAAVEEDVAGRHIHAEVYGLARNFYEELATYKTNNLETAAFGFGATAQVIPGLFDVQASGLTGRGVGRYGSGQLPDATFETNGRIRPIDETILLVGGILHATKTTDVFAYGGEEHDERTASGAIGYGNALFVNTGCEIQGSTAACTGNTRLLSELTTGLWQRAYEGPWGYLRIGLQYSYVERNAFSGVGGAPDAHENMIFTSFRYYPFQ